jgi:hypothetical protein
MTKRLPAPVVRKAAKVGEQVVKWVLNVDKRGFLYFDTVASATGALKLKGARVSSGIARTALITKDFVVKFPQVPCGSVALKAEADFINKMRQSRKYGRHFPFTKYVEAKVGRRKFAFVIQETVKNIDYDGRLTRKYHDEVVALAEKLGIDDMHQNNYGWAGEKGKEFPVFVDVDFRLNRSKEYKSTPVKKERSWMTSDKSERYDSWS